MGKDIDYVVDQFCEYYYNALRNDRSSLTTLYGNTSRMNWEKSECNGAQEIVEKLKSLAFEKIAFSISTRDAQPIEETGILLLKTTGQVKIDEEVPQLFSHSFCLAPNTVSGGYYICNEIFRFILG